MRELPVATIVPNPDQPRRQFDTAALEALAASLRERGVLQPVLVRPVLVRPVESERFQLIAGERRWRAAQLAELAQIPAFVREGADDAAALELALIENAAREDLTPVEVARTLSTLINDLGLTQATLARRIGRSRSDLANTMRLLDLADEILDLIDRGQLSKGHGKCLLAERDPRRRHALALRAASGGWSVRELERAIAAPAALGNSRSRVSGTDARELNERAAAIPAYPVTVRALGDAFAIRVVAVDRAHAETVLERLRAARMDEPTVT
ncbi:MAG TPA: ParB/RepB/Spo0J family partition protein [Solirubrobacter sp.]